MLLEFRCSNHKSIKEEILFSMVAGSDNTSEEFLKKFGDTRVLSSAVIYGANGSGKSNFIDAISFMSVLVGTSILYQQGETAFFQTPHKSSNEDTPSEYSIQFVKNNIRYAYGFSIKKSRIEEEYLYYFPENIQVKIFERNGMEVELGEQFKNKFEVSLDILKENRLFLSCAANYSNVKEVIDVFEFITKDIVIYNPIYNNWKDYSIKLMQDNKKIKEKFLSILKALGTGIIDVKTKIEDIKLPKEFEDIKQEKNFIITRAKVVYEKFEVDLGEESNGIQKLFQMICPIIDILDNDRILICDELESSLHESIIYEIVKLFHNNNKDKSAQLIFSTHDTSLLNKDLFRGDQIWFTQLNDERATDLYSLVEIKYVRKFENLEKGYISGKYGAIPMLNKAFFQKLEENINLS
jgi:hypothetical protein